MNMNFGKTTSIIISGSAFLYLLAQSTKFLSSRIKIDRKLPSAEINSRCCVCSLEKVEETNHKFVTCKGCESIVCSKTCSEFVNELDLWECTKCRKNRIIQQKTGEWFLKQLSEFSTFNIHMALGENIINVQNEKGNKVIISKVREIIEKCLSKILSGTDLDSAPIVQISENEEYLHLFKKHHNALTSLIFKLEKSIHLSLIYDLPNTSSINTDYVELKRFINRICHEVINIADTLEFSSNSSVPKASFDPQTYEELLATAVLNKITSDYQQRQKYGMSNQVTAENNSEIPNDEELDFNFYDKIQSHKISLPDLLNEFDTSHEDELSNGNHSGSWEDNWSLKKNGNENQRIAMLIPMPNYDVKTKIGEKDIDEISDFSNKDSNSENFDELLNELDIDEKYLSYIASSTDGNEDELFTDIFQSTTLENDIEHDFKIQDNQKKLEKNLYGDTELESETLFDKISDLSGNENKQNIDEIFEQILMTEGDNTVEKPVETKPDAFIPEIVDNSAASEKENIECKSEEITTKYKSPLLTQYLVKPIQPIKISEALKIASKNPNETKETTKSKEIDTKIEPQIIENQLTAPTQILNLNLNKLANENDNSPPIPGSIAEREHLKWLKAIPIENNPYSPEALTKRLSRSQDKYIDVHSDKIIDQDEKNDFDGGRIKEDITRYKRDYYINNFTMSTESVKSEKQSIESETANESIDYDINQNNDTSLTVSDDSLTRIYTLHSQETTILKTPHDPSKISHNEMHENSSDLEEIPLPSVKKLAEFYACPSTTPEPNTKHYEPMEIPQGISKSTSKMYQTTDLPAKPIASITARTLPPKIKEDLKRSLLHPDDAETIIRHNERNTSPDIQQGLARNSIAYFENFYK